MSAGYRYAGPDGEGIAALPEGIGAAAGSEYCRHLLPSPDRLAGLAGRAKDRGIAVLLLTPYFRDEELKAAMGLFRAIPAGATVEVAVNDWGLLLALRSLFPRLSVSIGRLLSGQKRCPRIGISARLTEEGRAWHGEGVFSSARARQFLEEEFGVRGYHVDDLEWMRNVWGDRIPRGNGAGSDGPEGGKNRPRLLVHGPWAIVTVTDRCPWIGGRSSADIPSCPRPCREGTVGLREPSMGKGMVQRGKARFLRIDSPGTAETNDGGFDARVLYADVP